ncbi:MAG: hypothetical protein V9H25_21230 [Candidatus Competibacter sp.]
MHVFTHDSIGLGEDGPTHQSIEHAASPAPDSEPGCVAPGLIPLKPPWPGRWPCSNKTKPTALLLEPPKHQPMRPRPSPMAPDACGLDAISKGAYVLSEPFRCGLEEEGPGRDHCHRLRSATGAEGASGSG